jgi:hypothetical protein
MCGSKRRTEIGAVNCFKQNAAALYASKPRKHIILKGRDAKACKKKKEFALFNTK